jgi:hypothetical protein
LYLTRFYRGFRGLSNVSGCGGEKQGYFRKKAMAGESTISQNALQIGINHVECE